MKTRKSSMVVVHPAAAQLAQHSEMTRELREKLARKSFSLCAERGFDVAVAVADSAGTVRTLIAGDEVSAISIETASRKARSAAWVGFPTAGLGEADRAAPAYTGMLRLIRPDLIMIGGGVPVRANGQLVGAIGVGGASDGAADERCANDALSALATHLR